MARIVRRTQVLLAELGWTIALKSATSAAKIVAPKFCTFNKVITPVKITTSAVISTRTEVSTSTEPPTPTAWSVSGYTTTNCYVTLVL